MRTYLEKKYFWRISPQIQNVFFVQKFHELIIIYKNCF